MPNLRPKTHKSISRTAMFLVIDAILVNAAMLLAIWLMNDMALPIPPTQLRRFANLWPVMTALTLLSFAALRMYSTLWSYASVDEVVQITLGTTIGMGATFAFSQLMMYFPLEENYFLLFRATYIIAWFLLTFFVLVARFSFRIVRRLNAAGRVPKDRRRRVLIVGAGWAASSVIRDLTTAGGRDGMAVVALDDDPAKAGTRIGSVPVKHGIENLPEYVDTFAVQEIIIAMPSVARERMREVVELCMATGCHLKIVPGLRDVTGARGEIGRAREINITDLLFREEVTLDVGSVSGYLQGKTVLVTGGGGSIGSEICRQVAGFSPKQLIIFDIYENTAYELLNELRVEYDDALDARVLIGSVRDEKRLDQVFSEYRPDVVFHTAAHKHVSLMEFSPSEAVKNNVFGTLNVARCADRWGVDRMVLISSDKAVNPTNIYGATKRVTELIMQSTLCRRSKTHFMTVRFGNVLGSHGSVVHLFQKQLAAGGPLRVTDPEMTRYFMTIPEAARLVLQAAAYNESGAVYILEMGTPVKMGDLARNFIRLSGYQPDVDIHIKVVGLLPGEKLYEELVMADEREKLVKTASDKIMVAHPVPLDEQVLLRALERLQTLAAQHPEQLAECLLELVPTFNHMVLDEQEMRA